MCNRVLLLFGKLRQRNLQVNCHANRTTFQSGLRFQTDLSLLRVSCKRALSNVGGWKMLDNISDCTKILLLQFTDQIAKGRAN